MELVLKHKNIHDNYVADIKEPLVSPWETLKNKISICLVYLPKKCYYWLIHDHINNKKDYKTVIMTSEPAVLEDSIDIKYSYMYQILRWNIVNKLNELDIEGLKYDLDLNPDETFEKEIAYKHIQYVNDVLYGYKNNCVGDLEDEMGDFKDIITDGRDFIKKKEEEEIIRDLQTNYTKRKKISKSNLDLSFLLTNHLKIGKQHITHLLYQLDEISNGYTSINFDLVHEQVNNLIGENLINTRDLETALSHSPAKLKPIYNMVKFNNCIMNYNTFELNETNESIFTVVETKYNYFNNEYPTITDFLTTSLAQETPEKTKKYILGVKELIGYLFCSGNQDQIMLFMVGVPGSGKSTLTNLISNIFGNEKVSDMKLQDPDKNTHATASLLGKHLNIARDSDTKPVENIGLLKQIRGYEDLQVNPKGRDIITIPKEEVPKFILVSNQMPIFKGIDEAFQETAVFIEFKHRFRGTNKEKDYNKGFEDSEVEGFIHDCIEAYKNKKLNDRKFILQEDLETNKFKFEMHSKPIHYLINELVRHDSQIPDTDGEDKVYAGELNEMCIKLAEIKGLSIKLRNDGAIDGRTMVNAIKDNFDLHDWKDQSGRSYTSTNDYLNENKKYYPNLVKKIDTWDSLNSEK